MAQLFTKLTEEFDAPSGVLINYVSLAGAPLGTRRHYDIRSFIGDDITVPRTMLDLRYNNVFGLDGQQMVVLDTPRIVSGRTIAARPIGNFNGLSISTMNTFKMIDLDVYTLSTGGENWPVDAAITVGKDSTERWANSIRVTLTGGVQKSVTSMFTDNIYSGMESNSSTYYIELALPGFPAQAAGSHLDLNNSWIDFTSDTSGSFAASQTNSFKFSDSLHSLTAGGDTYWQINRNSLTNVDLKNLAGIRFRLTSVGNLTFKAQALRVYKSDEYTFDSVDTETKRGQFKRSVPRASGAEPASPTISTYMMNYTRPKNMTLVGKFNSGHIDVANDSSFSLIIRNSDANNYITGNILVNNSRTQLNLTQTVNGVTTSLNQTNLGALSGEAYYFLVLEAYENQVRLSLYNTYGAFYGTLLGTSAFRTTTLVQRGRIGFDLKPYNYDFLVDYLTTSDAEFARFESKTFTSIKPVIGATVAAESSTPVDLTEGHFIPAGDATIDIDPQVGYPTPSIKFSRDGSNWQGGYMTDGYIFIGNPKYLKISGDVYPVLSPGQSSVRGTFRVVFIDKWDSVGYISYIRNLLPSQWNHFDIPLNSDNLAPGNYRILVQQTGFYNDVFYLDNLAVNHLSFSWEASTDGGNNWYKFLTAIDDAYSAVNLKDSPGRQLKIRATALSDNTWISKYEVIPLYGIPGHVAQITPGSRFTNNAYDVRLIGQGSALEKAQAARITGVANPGALAKDVRISGRSIDSTTWNVRITATSGTIRVNDVRVIGQLDSSTTYNVRLSGTNGSSATYGARIVGQGLGAYRGLLSLLH